MQFDNYRLELEDEVHQANVYNTIQNFGMYDMKNLVINCSNGEAVFTTKKFLGVFSSLVRDVCREFPEQETVNLFVPFTREIVDQMMDYLLKGELLSRNMEKLETVWELLKSLGIDVDDTEIIDMNNKPLPVKKKVKMETGIKEVREKRKYRKRKKEYEPGELDEHGEIPTDGIEVKLEGDDSGGGFKCKQCDKVFSSKSQLTRHKIVHTKEKSFECKECGKMFGTKSILTNHYGVHNPIKCEHCERPFAQKSGYMHHLKTVHNTEESK